MLEMPEDASKSVKTGSDLPNRIESNLNTG